MHDVGSSFHLAFVCVIQLRMEDYDSCIFWMLHTSTLDSPVCHNCSLLAETSCRIFQVDEMYREAPIKHGMFDYIEFTRILKHGAKDKDDQ